jgi:DNA-binding response OmpR family regulator
MKRILVAEDERAIREGLVDLLESEGYAVTTAADGESAMAAWKNGGIDLALLDIMMPKKSGYDVCREMRKTDEAVPIVFLSAREEEIDKVLGLELGADDYVVKPFGVRELAARVKAALRRAETNAGPGHAGGARADGADTGPTAAFTFGDCTVDPRRQELSRARGGTVERIELSSREVDLLGYFYANPETVHSRDDLLSRFWGVAYGGTTRTLDQHIAKLRQKIESDCANPRHILTVHGTGYRFRR